MAESLLPQPDTAVHMKVFQGGGSLSGGAVGGGGTESLLPQPSQAAPMYEFKGGGSGDPVHPFRGITLEELNKDENKQLKGRAVILEVISPENAKESQIAPENEIPIIPVIREKDGKTLVYKEGLLLETKAIKDIFFYGVKGGELTQDTLLDLFATSGNSKRLLIFRGDILKPSANQVFVEKKDAELASVQVYERRGEELRNESAETPKKPDVIDLTSDPVKAETIRLSSGYRVRYVTDAIKNDIINLKFTPMEQELFDTVIHFNHEFIKKYITSSDQSKEAFFKFWQTYINKDGTSKLVLMTNKEGREIQDYLQSVLEAYRKELQEKTLYFLRKQDSDITFDEYVKEREEDTAFFSAPKGESQAEAAAETPKAASGTPQTPPAAASGRQQPAAGTPQTPAAAAGRQQPAAGTPQPPAAAPAGRQQPAAGKAEEESKEGDQENIKYNSYTEELFSQMEINEDWTSIRPILSILEKLLPSYELVVEAETLIKNGDSIFNLSDKKYSSKIGINNFYTLLYNEPHKISRNKNKIDLVDLLQLLIRVRYSEVKEDYKGFFVEKMKEYGKDDPEKQQIEKYITGKQEQQEQQEQPQGRRRPGFNPPPKKKTQQPPAATEPTIQSMRSEINQKRKLSEPEKKIYKEEIIKGSAYSLDDLGITDDILRSKDLDELLDFYTTAKQQMRNGRAPDKIKTSGGRRKRITPRKSRSKSVSGNQSRKSRKVRSE
jgi:hypothetical protein